MASAAAGAGNFIALRLKKRAEILRKLIVAITAMKTEIKFSRKPPLQILKELSGRSGFKDLSFFGGVVKAYGTERDFVSAWSKALNGDSSVSLLTGEDREILSSLGAQLGTTDTSGQMKICELHLSMLQSNLKTAEEISAKYGKLCSQIGLFAGCAIGILLL